MVVLEAPGEAGRMDKGEDVHYRQELRAANFSSRSYDKVPEKHSVITRHS